MRRKKRASLDGGRGELFICFTSRPSASSSSATAAASMRAPSSKSLLSPGRNRDSSAAAAAPSLSASLSRRLRSSGSVKGGQSPMFPAIVSGGGRRKGCAFEAAEPSSPKVTCIGQVRVKSKKKKAAAAAAAAARGKASAMRARSMRGSRGEASFRRAEGIGGGRECLPSKNQRWVYQLPVSICEALRAFGSEFNCFFPCGGRSLCSSSSAARSAEERGEGERNDGKRSTSSCGAVLARWVMAIQETEEGKRGEVMGLVVEERSRDGEMEVLIKERVKKDELELEMEVGKRDEVVLVANTELREEQEEEKEEARVSICIPPRNALLLMRCRSDPVRMAALASRFWDSPAVNACIEEKEVSDEEEEQEVNDADCVREQCGHAGEEMEEDNGDEEAAVLVVSEAVEVVDQESGCGESTKEVHGLVEEIWKPLEENTEKEEQSPTVERNPETLDTKEGTLVEYPEIQRKSSKGQQDESVGAEVEYVPLEGKAEEKYMRNEAHLEHRNDEEEGEFKGRRFSSCSATSDKEERRSSKSHHKAKEGGRRRSSASREKDRRRHSFSIEREDRRPSFSNEREARRASFSLEGKRRWSFCLEKEDLRLEKIAFEEQKKEGSSSEEKEAEETVAVHSSVATEEGTKTTVTEEKREEQANEDKEDSQEKWKEEEQKVEEKRGRDLPDCLLLMMYEPKLSMEVSKETWVCSTDFLRWHPHHPRYHPCQPSKGSCGSNRGMGGGGVENELAKPKAETQVNKDIQDKDKCSENKKNGEGTDKCSENKEAALVEPAPKPPQQPPRAPPTASAVEMKLRGNVAVVPAPPPPPPYGPFVLTRCKSEPMRSSARLTPDACFWKDRHRPIGAAGIGF